MIMLLQRMDELVVKMYLDIYYTINFIRKVLHNKPSKEKVVNYLQKLNKECSYDLFDMNMDKPVKHNFIEIKGDDDQESLFLLKSLMNSLLFILRHQITKRKQKAWTSRLV